MDDILSFLDLGSFNMIMVVALLPMLNFDVYDSIDIIGVTTTMTTRKYMFRNRKEMIGSFIVNRCNS